jgi:hypothetical protein
VVFCRIGPCCRRPRARRCDGTRSGCCWTGANVIILNTCRHLLCGWAQLEYYIFLKDFVKLCNLCLHNCEKFVVKYTRHRVRYFFNANQTVQARVARFFLTQYTRTAENIPKLPLNYQMAIKQTKRPSYVPNDHRIYRPFQFQCPSKFTQIGNFGLKANHLATLVQALALFLSHWLCVSQPHW